jgi:hypothetical protein
VRPLAVVPLLLALAAAVMAAISIWLGLALVAFSWGFLDRLRRRPAPPPAPVTPPSPNSPVIPEMTLK